MHVKSVLNNYMSKQDYTVTPNLEYKDGSHSFSRFVDFLERFVQANQELIRDHDEKQSRGKKTRRIIPDRYFREVTLIMGQLLETFHKVTIKPVNSRNQYTIAEYYGIELSNWDRQNHDSKRLNDHTFNYERFFPVSITQQDGDELKKAVILCERLIILLREAPEHLTWPSCLRCLCWRKKKRTACCCRYTVLFGQIKQLGLILQTQFNAQHHWVKTADGCKLDCMFFRQWKRHSKKILLKNSDEPVDEQNMSLDPHRPCFIICNSNAMFY